MEERGFILKILNKVDESLRTKDYLSIKFESDKLINHTSLNQDADIISIAVIIYSLSKMLERQDYKKHPDWQGYFKEYQRSIRLMIRFIQKDRIDLLRNELKILRETTNHLTGSFKRDIKEVFRKARINKASKIYEHGISMEKTARILGISLWELSEYAGNKGSMDMSLTMTLPIQERIKIVEEIFS